MCHVTVTWWRMISSRTAVESKSNRTVVTNSQETAESSAYAWAEKNYENDPGRISLCQILDWKYMYNRFFRPRALTAKEGAVFNSPKPSSKGGFGYDIVKIASISFHI